jgi:DNA-binding response OmpR family regulator
MNESTASASAPDERTWHCIALVADDDRSLLEIFRRHLPRFGWKVLAAPDGLRALQILETEDVDAVIADERMPGLSGAALLEHVHETWPWVRLVLLAGWPTPDARERCRKIGACVVMKGAEFQELLDALGGPCGE